MGRDLPHRPRPVRLSITPGAEERAALLAALQRARARERTLGQRTRVAQRAVGAIAGIATFVAIRWATSGGLGVIVLGVSSLLFTAIVAAFVGLVAAASTEVFAKRWTVPARRARAHAESALWAHDATHGRRW